MPGFFTDEPQVSRNGIPWSLTLVNRYRAAFGEELLPRLPELFLPLKEYQRTRFRFWWLVQELFVTNFTQQIYEWCERNNAQLTGHMVLEETLQPDYLQRRGDALRVFSHARWTGRAISIPSPMPLQVSVAKLGKRAVLSETFALTLECAFRRAQGMFEGSARSHTVCRT